MKIICFPHFYYLSKVSRLVEMGRALRALGQDVLFFSHGGNYEYVAQEAGFEVVAVEPHMSPERAAEYMAFNRGEKGNPFRDSFFTYDELQAYVPSEADAFRQARADAVLIGWSLPSYLSAPLVGIPMHLEQTGNLSLVTRQGAGLMLSKWDLNRRSLGRALERLLADTSLRENMLRLKALQDKVDGPANAAREIVNFIGASKPRMEQAR